MSRRVAVIGYSFRFPGGQNFWQSLLDKRDLITEVDPRRWSKEAYLHPGKDHPGSSYTFAAGTLGDISGFDAEFFGLSPREVIQMDPQQRLMLEMSWEAIEHAGMAPSSLRGSDCGVFLGIASTDYAYRLADDLCSVDSTSATGTAASITSNRISYLFDLHGPSISMDTACSSSMVAFHQACRSILSGEIDQALTGSISLHLHPYAFLIFSKASMLSPSGRSRIFDEAGDGYVRSEGGGVFLLKEYHQALADGDRILAVVGGSAVNTDGSKSGLTVPNIRAQVALMQQVYDHAGLIPDDIDYLEAHGTGTAVGDPIESQAIGEALGKRRHSPLPIGSVKSNLGHLEAASGVAGMVKALLSIEHRTIPATIGIKQLNSRIRFGEWNIEVVREARQLPQDKQINIGINSFGFGGANAHVILSSPPTLSSNQVPAVGRLRCKLPLRISARSDESLRAAADRFAELLCENNGNNDFYDVAWCAHYRREHHRQGLLVFAETSEEAASTLRQFVKHGVNEAVHLGTRVENAKGPAFVYSGNGCQWESMGRNLMQGSPVFRRAVLEVDDLFRQHGDFSLAEELLGNNGKDRFEHTEIAQPALFALQVGITAMLRDMGIRPLAVAGHSVGEVAAAWAAGVLSLEDAVTLIFYRSFYQGQTAGSGEMLAVNLSAEEIEPLLDSPEFKRLSLTGINSARAVTLSGSAEILDAFEIFLEALEGVAYKRLNLNYAFHTPAMDGIKDGLIGSLEGLAPNMQTVPFVSTVTGKIIQGDKLDAEYWWHNIRKPVLFKSAVDTLLNDGINTFVEIGGHPVLRSYLNEGLRDHDRTGVIIATLERDQDETSRIDKALGQVLLAGISVDYQRWFPDDGRFISLPDYPWQKSSYVQPVSGATMGLLDRYYEHPLLGYRLEQQQLTWESQLDVHLQPWLTGHVVGDGVVFPGSGFVELGLAAADLWQSPDVIDIEELEILSPLLLFDDSSKLLRLSIAPENGEIRLNSRQLGSSNEWTHNFRARIMADSAGLLLTARAPECPDREADFSRETHIVLAKSLGLEYGPHFQAISHGWIEQGQAIGLFEFPDVLSNEMDSFLLHPGILDSAFQLFIPLLADEGRNQEGIAFVPIRVGRIQLARKGATSTPMLAQVELVQRSPHSLLANVGIFDDKRRAVALLQGVRFKAIALRSQRSQTVSYLDYYLTPFPLPEQQQPPRLASDELARILQAFYQKEGNGGIYAQEIEPLLDSLVQGFMVRTLEEHLCNISHLDNLSKSEVARWLSGKAAIDGLVSVNDNGVAVLEAKNEVDPEVIWEGLLRDYPDYFALIHLVGRFGLHLGESLKDPERIADIDLGQKLYSSVIQNIIGPGGVTILAEGVATCVATMVQSLSPGRRLSVTEVGADSPLFASAICRKLDFGVADYSFISPYLEANVEVESINDDFPLSRLTSLELDSGALGNEVPKAHVLIVHLDFLSLEDARRVLQLSIDWVVDFARVILVSHHPAYWVERIFGAGSASLGTADHSQQATVAEWQQLLCDIGYENVLSLDLQGPEIGSALLSCTAPKWISATLDNEPLSWMVVAGKEKFGDEYAERICAALNARGGRVYRVDENSPNLQEHVRQAEQEMGSIDRVVFLDDVGNRNLVDGQTARCKLATALVQACDKSSTLPIVWLLTQGVADMYTGASSTPPAADAFFWGFARTLINEAEITTVRLLDLPAGENVAWPMEVLLETLSGADEEQEVFIMSDGARMSSRLKLMKPPDEAPEEVKNSAALTLESRLPGQLKDLRWIAHELRQPEANEVEIEVCASGLNFRDVMYSLGHLPDEAIENGLSGPTLGLEFAGRVVTVGAGVSSLAVGDDVVGFGSASFSTKLIAQETCIAKIPLGLSYEAAVTIPTTFFTAYYALKYLAHVQPGERVLIHGAAGGVGIAAIQVAQWLGADIYVTVGSQEKRDFLKLLGVDNIFNSRSLTFAEELMAQTPDASGVDVILNCLSGEAIAQNLRALKPFGRFLELGKRDFFENTSIGLRPFRNNISYFAIDSDQLMKDRPDLARALFLEVMDLFESNDFYPLPYTLFTADQVVEAFRFVQQARQIGKVVIGYRSRPLGIEQNNDTPEALSLSPEKTYLVTGGLSGFGLRTAQWLVEKGARYLVLINRKGLNAEGAALAVEELEAQGVTVVARSCDVTNRDKVLLLLEECAEVLPPIKGVVHAATVINDGLAANLSSEQIRDVLGPKVSGAWNLHELTNNLDFFVLFSSATTLFGNPGQASYVAANHWLEALAAHRRNIDESVTCVRWGPIDDAGFLARNPDIKDALLKRMGGTALSSETALCLLEQMILSRSSTLGVMDLNWSVLRKFMPSSAVTKYREISSSFEDFHSEESFMAEYEKMVNSLTAQELKEAIAGMLGVELGTILLIPVEKIDINRSLYDMGIDSLMGLELVIAIEARFGVQFPVMILSEAPTLYKLAEMMIKKLNGENAELITQVVDEQYLISKHGVELDITG